ncbi:MAG: hypothetical protein IKV03_04265 [Alphaproteobacteria bacterium]|nr:hypothetical protein [Alphaproteobacteria bacterium]
MDSKSTGCLCTLAFLGALVGITIQCCDKRESLSLKNRGTIGTLIKSTTENDKTYYFIDTDKNLKTAEYVLTTEIGETSDIQLKAKILNHTDKTSFQMPLAGWRSHSILFERVHD